MPSSFKIATGSLGPLTKEVFSGMGCDKELLAKDYISSEELPPEVARLVEHMAYGKDVDKTDVYSPLNRFCKGLCSADGNESNFSEEEMELFKKLSSADFRFVSCNFRTDSEWKSYGEQQLKSFKRQATGLGLFANAMKKVGLSYEITADRSISLYISDRTKAEEFDDFLDATDPFGKHNELLMQIFSFPGFNYSDNICNNLVSIDERLVGLFETYKATKEDHSQNKEFIGLLTDIQEQYDNETIFKAAFALNLTTNISDKSYDDLGGRIDLNLLTIDEMRTLRSALKFTELLSEATGIDKTSLSDDIAKYKDIGFENAAAFLHYFVNPNKFPAPEKEILPGELPSPFEETLTTAFIEKLCHLFQRDIEFIPAEVLEAMNTAVQPVMYGVKADGKDVGHFYRSINGSMVCLDTFEKDGQMFGIYATASHVINKDLKPKGFEIYNGGNIGNAVSLVAIPLSDEDAKIIPVKTGAPPSSNDAIFIASKNGEKDRHLIGSDPKFTDSYSTGGMTPYKNAEDSPNEIMLFRGLAIPGDSGGAILNEKGELVGIVLGGDQKLTVAGYADMAKLSQASNEFKQQILANGELTEDAEDEPYSSPRKRVHYWE